MPNSADMRLTRPATAWTLWRWLRPNHYDAVVLDIMMPRLDGFSACKEIKKTRTSPSLCCLPAGEEYDKLFGFELGIDDYMVKPFSPKELMARLNVVISRHSGTAFGGDVYRYEGLEVDFSGRTVKIDGEEARLTPKEYDLLFLHGAKQKHRLFPPEASSRRMGI